jgi:hypothetical protein
MAVSSRQKLGLDNIMARRTRDLKLIVEDMEKWVRLRG